MSRDMRVSTLRQMPNETNAELLNRLFEDLLVIEYTGYPLEERRISHFIIMHFMTQIIDKMLPYSTNTSVNRLPTLSTTG